MNTLSTMRGAAWLFVAAWCVHAADHLRRGLGASPEGVTWAGTLVAIVAAVAITLVISGHSSAPAVATAVFPSIAIGVIATHLLPQWGPLSDPVLVASNSDMWSIPAVLVEIVAGFWLGLVALGVMRRHDFARSIPAHTW